jgi:hypothetical protein
MVAFYMLLLERSFIMDFSLLCLKGKWEGIAGRLGPDGFAGPP